MRLLIALYNEHRQRTGHDCLLALRNGIREKLADCDVCLYLGPMMEDQERIDSRARHGLDLDLSDPRG